MTTNPTPNTPVKVFFSYSHLDNELRIELEKHLTLLRRQGYIANWHDRMIDAGTEWKDQIDEHLDAADIILLLISSNFIASDYCYDTEMKRAMERHNSGEALVIPVILRPCVWKSAPFGKLQALPEGGKAVTSCEDRNEPFASIAEEIRKIVTGRCTNPDTVQITSVEEPLPPRPPVPPWKRLWHWIIPQKRWPLLLIPIIPLSHVALYGDVGLRFLIVTGVSLLVSGLLYWIVRRQMKRLWQSAALGVAGGIFILAGIPKQATCSPPNYTGAGQGQKNGLVVTIAKLAATDPDLKRSADDLSERLYKQIREREGFIVKQYGAVADETQRKQIEELAKSEDCKCDVFIWGTIRKSPGEAVSPNSYIADFSAFTSGDLQEGRYNQGNSHLISYPEAEFKDQKDAANLVSFLVGLAHYKRGELEAAIKVLNSIDSGKAYFYEAYFYKGMCLLELGIVNKNKEYLESSISNFDNAIRYTQESDELNLASKFNRACAKIYLSSYIGDAEAIKQLDSAIEDLETVGERYRDANMTERPPGFECNLEKINITAAQIEKYRRQPTNGQELLDVAEAAATGLTTCPVQNVKAKNNMGYVLTILGKSSDNPQEFTDLLNEAVRYYENALNIIDEYNLLQYRNMVEINRGDALSALGLYEGKDQKRYLEQAVDIYKKVLDSLSKDVNRTDWVPAKLNYAAASLALGKLGGPDFDNYFENAIAACREVLSLDAATKNQRAIASSNLGGALFERGIRRGKTQGTPMLEEAIKACAQANEIFKYSPLNLAFTEKIMADAYYQLSDWDDGMRKQYRQKANISYANAKYLCSLDGVIYKRVCSQITARIN